MARHYPPETVKPAENKREAGPKEKKATAPKNDGKTGRKRHDYS